MVLSPGRRVEASHFLANDSGEPPRTPRIGHWHGEDDMPAREICEASWVTPQSRRREPAGDRGRQPAASGRRAGGAGLAGPPPNAPFAPMLRAAPELLAGRTPLGAQVLGRARPPTRGGPPSTPRGPKPPPPA